MSVSLSKSLYIKGLQCQKALWLEKHNKAVLTLPGAAAMATIEGGNAVGSLACALFPGGRKITTKSISLSQKVVLTQKWINEGVHDIYEATFEFDGVLVMVDILHKNADGSFEIYEVKSSTKAKDIFKQDVSIQYYVLNGLGYDVSDVYITILNTDYVRSGELDIKQLFTHVKVTSEVLALQGNIPANLGKFRDLLTDGLNEPDIDIGWHCKNPHECDAMDYCWQQQRGIPEYSVFNIFSLTKTSKALGLYQQGIVDIKDIPDDMKLTDKQKAKVDAWKAQKGVINKDAIKSFVDSINYPIYHFDFETLGPAIPSLEGMKPYEKYPFQYSLHIEQEDGSLEHKEYLAIPGQDPREEIVKRMVEDIPTDACVMAFNISFEKSIIRTLANNYPDHKTHLMNIHDNFIDLEIPFQNGDYWMPSMQGHYGLKYALPATVPEMKEAYPDLDSVHNGTDAMAMFKKLGEATDFDEIAKIKSALLEYCKLDTYAMVKILNNLKVLIK
ncbi:DUF2779 domain-containing protein [Candidatus Thioglobus sp.]|nr:DUF2779 domain-containing protein [Candidatus Thioglobus sp.]